MSPARIAALSAFLALTTLCPGEEAAPETAAPQAAPMGGDTTFIGGPVISILEAGRYQYLEIDSGSGSVWVAAVHESISTGQHVTCRAAMAMPDFESKALGRKFDLVYFADALKIDDGAKATAATESTVPVMQGETAVCPHAVDPVVTLASMEKPEGGVTLAELVEGQEKLAGTDVLLRAQVTQVTLDILEANWLHVRDASTERDLVVSCKTEPKVGDVVLIKGRLARNVAIGGEHVYDLVLEGAEVTPEQVVVP